MTSVPATHEQLSAQLVVTAECRELRRSLRPFGWLLLEELALQAVVEGGRLVAHTSARRLAEDLRIDPGTVVRGLRDLRDRHLVHLEQETGPSGRFGLAVYVLHNVDGLTVVTPCGENPATVEPHTDGACAAPPSTAETRTAKSHMVTRDRSSAQSRSRRKASSSFGDRDREAGQGRLGL